MELAQLNEEFLSYLEVDCNRSPATISAYASDFRLFRRFVGPRPLAPEDVDRKVVRQYITWLRAERHKPNSITRRLASLRSFWRYLRDNGYTESDPFLRVSIPSRGRPLPTWLTVEECERLLAAAERQPSITHAYRDRAVLGLLLFCGLRKAELLALGVASVDLSEGTVRVERGKGGKGRVLPMPLRLVSALGDWLDLRPLCRHERLFTSSGDAPLGGKGLASILRRSLHRAGITKRCTLHHLRHSFACLLLQGGCDLYSLSQMLGHARLDATAYLHASARNLHRAAAKHPLAGGEQSSLQHADGPHFAGHVGSRVLHVHAARAVPHEFGDGALVNVRPDQEGVEGGAAGSSSAPLQELGNAVIPRRRAVRVGTHEAESAWEDILRQSGVVLLARRLAAVSPASVFTDPLGDVEPPAVGCVVGAHAEQTVQTLGETASRHPAPAEWPPLVPSQLHQQVEGSPAVGVPPRCALTGDDGRLDAEISRLIGRQLSEEGLVGEPVVVVPLGVSGQACLDGVGHGALGGGS